MTVTKTETFGVWGLSRDEANTLLVALQALEAREDNPNEETPLHKKAMELEVRLANVWKYPIWGVR